MTVKTYDTFGDNAENDEKNCSGSCEKKAIFALLICAIIALGFVLVEYYEASSSLPRVWRNQSWDYLLFTQQWPISYCTEYTEEKKEPVTECNFADDRYAWTIHGIWPSRSNSADYPQFCGRIPFNATALAPIEDELEEHWQTIQKDAKVTYLWRHEWLKHGTCAAQIEALNSEIKYFSQGLAWNKQYNVTDAFTKCGIYPDDGKLYTSEQIIQCVQQNFNVEPQIFCQLDSVRNELLLTEVRFCFDKQLNLKGCDTFGATLHCNGEFIYPGTVAES